MLVDGYRLTWSNMVYYIAPIGVFRCLVVKHKRCHMLELQPSIPVDSATTIKYMPVLNLESEGGHPNEWLLGIEAPFAATTAVPADFKIQCARYMHHSFGSRTDSSVRRTQTFGK